jgi:hypothetical protein
MDAGVDAAQFFDKKGPASIESRIVGEPVFQSEINDGLEVARADQAAGNVVMGVGHLADENVGAVIPSLPIVFPERHKRILIGYRDLDALRRL